MVEYKCDKCGYFTTKKSHYLNHLSRKKPCIIDNKKSTSLTCSYCNKTFSHRQSKSRHLKTCKSKNSVNLKIINLEETIKMLKRDNEKLKLEKDNMNKKLLKQDSHLNDIEKLIKKNIKKDAEIQKFKLEIEKLKEMNNGVCDMLNKAHETLMEYRNKK